MKKHLTSRCRRCAALMMALPLAVAGVALAPLTAEAAGYAQHASQSSKAEQANEAIVKAEKINPTTIEITYANGKHLTVDFYGEIFSASSATTTEALFAIRRLHRLHKFW